jgi:hypothetical protein
MRCPDPTLHDPQAQPVAQLLYATLQTRRALDEVMMEITRLMPLLREEQRERNEMLGSFRQVNTDPDPLYGTSIGQALESHRTQLRGQLAHLARQYIALGIEERQIKVFEEWSNLLLPLLSSLLDDPDLALSRAQRRKAPEVIERHLKQLEPPDKSELEAMIA